MKRIDISFLELVRYLKKNRPVTHQALAKIGFSDLHKDGNHYTETSILLRDGNVIEKIELREHAGGSFLILRFGVNTIKRDDIESAFGKLRLFAGPRGESVDEVILYGNDTITNFIIMLGLDQVTREPRCFFIESVTSK